MKLLLFSILMSPLWLAYGQTIQEKKEVETVVREFFTGLNQKDTSTLKNTLLPSCRLETVEANGTIRKVATPAFFQMLVSSGTLKLEENISVPEIRIDGPLAMAWMDYQFFVNGKLSHCGSNLFTLTKGSSGWRIHSIIDSRRKECQ